MSTMPKLQVEADAQAAAAASANLVRDLAIAAIQNHGRCTIALSGGSTPRAMYNLLSQPPYVVAVDWDHVELFWSDERCVPPDHAESNYRMAREALLDHIPIDATQVHRMPGEAPVPEQAARSYADELRAVFGKKDVPRFDVMLLGLGEDGHTASIFPGVRVPDDPDTLAAAVYVPNVKMWRLTLTLPVINAAAHVLFLVSGANKRGPLRALINGPRSLDLPAQRVNPAYGSLTIVADRAAASGLGA